MQIVHVRVSCQQRQPWVNVLEKTERTTIWEKKNHLCRFINGDDIRVAEVV